MSCVTASTYFAKGSSAFRSLYPARSPNAYLVLSVVDLADEAVAENADVHRGICRRGGGVLATVTLFGRRRVRVLGMMTAAVGQGAGLGRDGPLVSGSAGPATCPGRRSRSTPTVSR